jgi:hypothetical protein
MKRFVFVAFLATAAFAGEWTGYISESKCGAKHNTGSAGDVACVKGCIKGGAKPVLVVDGQVVAISNTGKVPESLYGLKAKVKGELKEGSLTIESIEAAQ